MRLCGLALLVIIFATGCSSIVRKPEVNGVRKVAIASLYASQDVIYKHGNEKYSEWGSTTRERVAKMAYQAFEEELKKLGWETVPYEKVIASQVYQNNFGAMKTPENGNLLEKGVALMDQISKGREASLFFTLPKMSPIKWEENNQQFGRINLASLSFERPKSQPEKLKEVANDLGVDAVLVVQMDYCYGDGVSVLGNGEAYIIGQASMNAVDKHGSEVVTLPPIKTRCETEPYGGKSSHSVAILNRKLPFGDLLQQDKMVSMFYEATKSTANSVVHELDVAINK